MICVICGRIFTQTYSIYIIHKNPNVSRKSRRFTQTKPKTTLTSQPHQTVFLCVIMQLAAFPLRDLRNLRENNMQEDSIYIAQTNPQKSPADLADLRRRTTKKRPNRNNLITISNCLSLRDNAACCIPLRDLRENIHIRVLNLYCTNETPEVSRRSRRSRRLTQTNHKNNISAD